MTGTNHALTGALLTIDITAPAVLVPAAIMSHFALDSLPHFGEPAGKRSNLSKVVWSVDACLLLIGLILLIITQNWLAMVGAFAAISPDFTWIYRFAVKEKWGSLPPTKTNALNRWHARIQKFETRKGLWVEIVWFCVVSYLCLEYVL